MTIQENIAHGLNRAFFQNKPKQQDIETIGIYVEPVLISHDMPTIETGYDWYKETYHQTESNKRPVEATHIELGYKIEELEREVVHQKTNFEQLHHANHKLIDEIREWEVKFRNMEFANKKLQAKVEELEGFEQYGLWVIQQYLNLKKELGKS